METIDVIADKVKNGLLHIPKEIFVLGFSASGKTFMPGLRWPICSHSNNDEQQSLIQSVVKLSADDNIFNRNKLLNFSTNGDASRGQIFASMMEKDATTFSFGFRLEGLPLFDVEFGTFGHIVNYYAKHFYKRLRNTLISMKKTIGIHAITHALLNPMDKQNVPYATELLLRVQNFSEKADDIP